MTQSNSANIARGYSTSTTGLSESKLHEKHLCDYVANIAKGCPHGCEFCFNKASPQYVFDPGDEIADRGRDGSDDWGDYALYRDRLPETVANQVQNGLSKWTEYGRGVVGLSFGTDPYYDTEAARITGITLRVLRDWVRPARILTRNPALAWQRHRDLLIQLAQDGLVTIGASIPHLDEAEVAAIEPRTQPVERRLEYLKKFSAAGVPTYVSMSPTYPTVTSRVEMRELIEAVAAVNPTVIFHEPINPRKGNIADCIEAADQSDADSLANALGHVNEDRDLWRRYACQHFAWVQQLGTELDLPVHLWPDKQLVQDSSEEIESWLSGWRSRQSQEGWPERPAPSSSRPAIPDRFAIRDSLETPPGASKLQGALDG